MAAGRLDLHLQQARGLPQGLLERATRLAELNQALAQWLSPRGSWAAQVALANIRAPQVTLIVRTVAVATPLRYCQQDILRWFSEHTGEQITRLHISIQAMP
jgi:hypothetical protein